MGGDFLAYSFEEIMAYHPDNMDVYQEIKRFLPKLVPFIGAGLTQFAYSTWSHALKTLSGKLTNSTNVQRVVDLIDSECYLDAAQLLEDFRTSTNLARDIAGLFSSDKLEEKREQLPREPLFLLPYLFPELVVTTNFDEALETIYRESGQPFRTVFLPGHFELLRQLMRQGGVRGLFKLHGSVTDGLIEYEKIVFTKIQYDRHYGTESPLPKELKACFENRMMFFLGCSLNNDRTMELLQEVIHPGDNSYTIIDCEPLERDEKIRQLGGKRVRAILYEKGRHEAVRVILEHLLEEIDPEGYQRLPFHVGALKSIDLSERFSYKANIVPFVGRGDELRVLNAFLGDSHIAFRWWAITGPGGSGKSRLAYELQKQSYIDWAVHYLAPNDYTDLPSLTTKLSRKTLLIADYVQENAKAIGKWMEQINDAHHSLPIRVLLVEREFGIEETDSGWARQLYMDVHHEQKLRNACYQENFLELRPLHDDDLLNIIENYAIALKQSGECVVSALSDTAKQMLLQKLKSVDPVLCRPLYALFLTDAYVTGQNPGHWDRRDVLEYVTTRESSRLRFSIRHIYGQLDEKLYAACLHLKCMATVLQDASLEELQECCPDAWATIQGKADSFVSPEDMLELIGLSVKEVVFALRPDLIGEYFVYTWLIQHRAEVQRFLDAAWRYNSAVVFFFHVIDENAQNWESVLLGTIPSSEVAAEIYASILSVKVYCCDVVEEVEQRVKLLEVLTYNYPQNSYITNIFAKSLADLSEKQDEADAWATIARLKCLAEKYPESLNVAITLAQGLSNLINKQDELGIQDTIERIQHLAKRYIGITSIAVLYAKGLFNLSNKQNKLHAHNTIRQLEDLVMKYPNVPDIAIELAKGLFNLSIKQDETSMQDTVRRLEYLVVKCPDVSDIVVVLARGLSNLSSIQDESGIQGTVDRLVHLVAEYPNVRDIVVELARGLLNLSVKQDEPGARETIDRLVYLAIEHPDVPDITIVLARGLFNLSIKQDELGRRETVDRLAHLVAKYPDMPDIAIMFACSLFILSIKQNELSAQETVERLEHLFEEYPDVPDILILLTKSKMMLNYKRNKNSNR